MMEILYTTNSTVSCYLYRFYSWVYIWIIWNWWRCLTCSSNDASFAFPAHIAVATSMFIVFLSAIVSSATHISLGNVSWIYALILIPGAWIGGKIGAYINTKLSGNAVINLLRITLIILGTRLIIISFYNVFFLECVFLIHEYKNPPRRTNKIKQTHNNI